MVGQAGAQPAIERRDHLADRPPAAAGKAGLGAIMPDRGAEAGSGAHAAIGSYQHDLAVAAAQADALSGRVGDRAAALVAAARVGPGDGAVGHLIDAGLQSLG